MSRVASGFHGIVQSAHDFRRLDVDRVFMRERADLITGNKAKEADMAMQIFYSNFDTLDM